jgi:hypothetical protein
MSAFAPLFAPAVMQQALADAVPEWLPGTGIVERCEVMHVWRRLHAKPGRQHLDHAVAVYRLWMEAPFAPVIITCRAALQRPDAMAPGGVLATHGQLHLQLTRFPEDEALPGLAAALAQGATTADVVAYRPAVRCTLRVARPGRGHAYAKVLAGGLSAAVAARVSALQRLAEQGTFGGGLRVAPLLAVDALGIVWQSEVGGRSPVSAAGVVDALVTPVWRAVAALHRAELDLTEALDRATLLQEATRKVAKLEQLAPDLLPDARRIEARLSATLAALPAARPVTLHGDVHLRQFMVETVAGKAMPVVTVFDLDEMARGDAEFDFAALWLDVQLASSSDVPLAPPAGIQVHLGLFAWYLDLHRINRAYRALWRHDRAALPQARAALTLPAPRMRLEAVG